MKYYSLLVVLLVLTVSIDAQSLIRDEIQTFFAKQKEEHNADFVAGKQLLRRISLTCNHFALRQQNESSTDAEELSSLLNGLASVERLYQQYRMQYNVLDSCFVVQPEEVPHLAGIVFECAEHLNVEPAHIMIADAPGSHLVATGGVENDAAVLFITTGFLYNATEKEIRAVMCHELAHLADDHIANRMLLSIVLMLLATLFFLAGVLWYVRFTRVVPFNFRSLALLCSVLGLFSAVHYVPRITTTIVRWYVHSCEFAADATARRVVGARDVKDALARLKTLHDIEEERLARFYHDIDRVIMQRASQWPWLQEYLRADVAAHRTEQNRLRAVHAAQHPSFDHRIKAL